MVLSYKVKKTKQKNCMGHMQFFCLSPPSIGEERGEFCDFYSSIFAYSLRFLLIFAWIFLRGEGGIWRPVRGFFAS